jgi:hypothetical protein
LEQSYLTNTELATIREISRTLVDARAKHPMPTFAAAVEEFLEMTRDLNDGSENWRQEAIDTIVVLFRLLVE